MIFLHGVVTYCRHQQQLLHTTHILAVVREKLLSSRQPVTTAMFNTLFEVSRGEREGGRGERYWEGGRERREILGGREGGRESKREKGRGRGRGGIRRVGEREKGSGGVYNVDQHYCLYNRYW